jgi:hypothetical protein
MINLIFYLTTGIILGLIFFTLKKDMKEEDKIRMFGLIVLFFPLVILYQIFKKIIKKE